MAAVGTTVRGLSTEELQTIRDGLATGRKPKVVFTEAAGQIAGQVGQVVELTDPALSDEWVVVRFGKDELPFSPTDLAVAPKGTPARRAAPAGAAEPRLRLTEPPAPVPREPMPVEEQQMPTKSASPAGKAAGAAADKPPARADKPPAKADTAKADTAKAANPDRPAAAVPAPRRSRPGKPKGPAGLTVTVAYADGEWTVAAQQGSKTVAKPYVIGPAEALKMVGLLDVTAVQEAVEQIVTAERTEAEHQAEKLRAELAEVEARLAELRDAA